MSVYTDPAEVFAVRGGWEREFDRAFNSLWKRREPLGDTGDTVILQGATILHTAPETLTPAFVVSSSSFGSVPPGWSAAVESFEVKEFDAEYEPVPAGERRQHADEQRVAAEATTARLVKDKTRVSGWARS